MQIESLRLLRTSLILVWLGTAVISMLNGQEAGHQLLLRSGMTSEATMRMLIWFGSAVDMVIGLLLWLKPGRISYWLTLVALAVLTLIATLLLPSLWLDPLGPLLKNLPICFILLVLLRENNHG